MQVVGGYLSGSVAILADSAHVASDVLASGLSIYVSVRARTHAHVGNLRVTYARISALLLLCVLGWIFFEAFTRFYHPSEVHGPLVIAIALVGLAGNLLQLWILHPEKNITGQLQSLHTLEDAASSIAVVLAGVAISLSHIAIIDPVISIGLVVYFGYQALRRLLFPHDKKSHHAH